MPSALIDSNIFIWGVKRQAEPGFTSNIKKAVALIEELRAKKFQLFISDITIGEIGFKIKEDQVMIDFIEETSKEFALLPFDSNAAFFYSRLLKLNLPFKQNQTIDKLKTKNDLLIISSACSHKIDEIWTGDSDFIKLTNKAKFEVPKIRLLSDFVYQPNLIEP